MPSALLALFAALSWGTSDYFGGSVTRRVGAFKVVFGSALVTFVLSLLIALPMGLPASLPAALGWGVAGAFAVGGGAVALYMGLATRRMSVVAPTSALTGALIPVAWSLITGERPPPAAMIGVALAVPAIWLLSGGGGLAGSGIWHGLAAGAGFGLFFIFFGNAPEDAGLWPLVAARATSSVGFAIILRLRGEGWHIERSARLPVAAVGIGDAAASAAYLFATVTGLVSLSAVLASLYPAPTVALAAVLGREPLLPRHLLGGLLALGTVALIAVS